MQAFPSIVQFRMSFSLKGGAFLSCGAKLRASPGPQRVDAATCSCCRRQDSWGSSPPFERFASTCRRQRATVPNTLDPETTRGVLCHVVWQIPPSPHPSLSTFLPPSLSPAYFLPWLPSLFSTTNGACCSSLKPSVNYYMCHIPQPLYVFYSRRR